MGFAFLQPAAHIAVATLFDSLWEAALVTAAVWVTLRFAPNVNATTRYAGWCIALGASLVLPIASAIPQISVEASAPASHRRVTAAPPAASNVVRQPVAAAHGARGTTSAARAVPVQAPHSIPTRLRFALPDLAAAALFLAWALAVLALLARLTLQLVRLERLKRDALPIQLHYRDRLRRYTGAEKGGRDVRLCVCDRIDVPIAVGLFDSLILIPQHLLDQLSQDEVDQITLHELAHLRRGDDWTNALQRVMQALFFFNPAVLFIAAQLDLEREVACDDWVIGQTGDVRPYASCLTKMAEVTAWPHRAMAAPGAFITRRGLSIRVERLLKAGRNIRSGIAFGPAGTLTAALVVLFFLIQSVSPSFAFTTAGNIAPKGSRITSLTKPNLQRREPSVSTTAKSAPQHASQPSLNVAQASVARTTAAPEPARRQRSTAPPQRPHFIHVREPARTIRIPAINIDIPMPQVHVAIPAMSSSGCLGCDYRGKNLSGRNFRGRNFTGADFSDADLQRADFSHSTIVGSDFNHANLRDATFAGATITGCDFKGADITGVNFDGVRMTGCDPGARTLAPAQARALLMVCNDGCDFSHANFAGQDLRGADIVGDDLTHADLRNTNLSGATLNGVDLHHALLSGARLDGATFTACDLSGVDLTGIDVSHVRFIDSSFAAH